MNALPNHVSPLSAGPHDAPLIAGVELGGTKCVCTLARGPELIIDQRSVPTGLPDETLCAINDILDIWSETHSYAAIGIGSFGPIDLDKASATYGFILETNKSGWAMTDVAGVLSGHRALPTEFDTDVNGAALAEIAWGSGIGLADFAFITVGTGVGVGLIVDGRPTRGIGHSELGHILIPRLDDDDTPSACRFHRDCVEGLAAGPAIEMALSGQRLRDADASHLVWTRVADAIAKLCHGLVCATGPKRISVGGGVFLKQPHLLSRIEPMLRASLNGYMRLPDDGDYIVAPTLGELAGPLGSIALGLRALAATR